MLIRTSQEHNGALVIRRSLPLNSQLFHGNIDQLNSVSDGVLVNPLALLELNSNGVPSAIVNKLSDPFALDGLTCGCVSLQAL